MKTAVVLVAIVCVPLVLVPYCALSGAQLGLALSSQLWRTAAQQARDEWGKQ